jgi:tRNA(Glu) U13 pseudouridine synthase TruD
MAEHRAEALRARRKRNKGTSYAERLRSMEQQLLAKQAELQSTLRELDDGQQLLKVRSDALTLSYVSAACAVTAAAASSARHHTAPHAAAGGDAAP